MINITHLFTKHNVAPEDAPIISEMIALMIAACLTIPEGNDRLAIQAMKIAVEALESITSAEVGLHPMRRKRDGMLMMPMAKGTH